MAIPPSTVTPGSGSWIWTNHLGDYPATSWSIGSSTEVDVYRFQADASGSFTFTVSGGTLDSMLRIYDSSGAALTGPIDSQFAGGTESVTLNLTAGNWYYVAVSGFQTSIGSYNLGIN